MNTVILSATHIVCPSCKMPDKTVDHLKGQRLETMWYCDQCGKRYSFTVLPNLTVEDLKATGEHIEKALVLLRQGKVGLVVEGMIFHSHSSKEDSHGHQFFYDEHTCPINFMRYVRAVVDLGSKSVDPHGIFEYVTTLPWDEKINECNNDDLLHTLVPYFTDPPVSFTE